MTDPLDKIGWFKMFIKKCNNMKNIYVSLSKKGRN